MLIQPLVFLQALSATNLGTEVQSEAKMLLSYQKFTINLNLLRQKLRDAGENYKNQMQKINVPHIFKGIIKSKKLFKRHLIIYINKCWLHMLLSYLI